MTNEEAVRKLEYSKTAYQMLIDEKVDSGKLVEKDVKGEWKADTPLDEAYKSMIEALEMGIKAIKALEQEPKTDSWSIKDVVDTFKKHGLIRVQEPSGNAINRKLAYAFIDGLISDDVEREKGLEYIRNMPPVNPTKTGHWIWCIGSHKCSNCEEYTCFSHKELLRYCPNCGARMDEPQSRK